MRVAPTIQSLLCCVVLLGAAFLIFEAVDSKAHAYPQPALTPRDWEFDFKHTQPRPIAVKTTKGTIEWYWYLTYTVTNNTGQDRLWIPEFTVATDKGQIITANHHIPSLTYEAIKKKERRQLLISPIDIVGKLLQGEDFAKEGLAIWPAFKKDVDAMDIFVAGLSGETAAVHKRVLIEKKNNSDGEADDQTPQYETLRVILRKSLMLKYQTPGTGTKPQAQEILPRGEEWVMR